MLAEKLATAILVGEVKTRVRDYADIYTLTGRHDLTHTTVRAALVATARFRGVTIAPLSSVIDDFVALREPTCSAYQAALGVDGAELPSTLVVAAVTAFANPLSCPGTNAQWRAAERAGFPRRSQERSHRRWSSIVLTSPYVSRLGQSARMRWTEDTLPTGLRPVRRVG